MSKKESNPNPPENVTWGTAIARYTSVIDNNKNLTLRVEELYADLMKSSEALLTAYDMQSKLIDIIEEAHRDTTDQKTADSLLQGLKSV